MLYSQLSDDVVLLVKPHGASAVLGCHKEDTDMRVCGGKGEIQVPFYRLEYPVDGHGRSRGSPRQLVQFKDHEDSTRDTAQHIE